MSKVKKVKIADKEFQLHRLPAEESLLFQLKVAKVLGGLLNLEVPDDVDFANMNSDSMKKVLPLIGQGASNIDPVLISSLIIEMCNRASLLEGDRFVKIEFDLVFSDDLVSAYLLAWEYLNFEYASFIKGAKLLAPKKKNTVSENQQKEDMRQT